MGGNVIDLARDRREILDLLRDGPFVKRDVVDASAQSRSTVDRAVTELRSAGLVTHTDEGYETTVAGVVALRAGREYERDARAIREAADSVNPLWKETPIDTALLREAAYTSFDAEPMDATLREFDAHLRGASAIRAALGDVPTATHLRTLHEVTTERDVSVELTCGPGLFEALLDAYPGWFRDVASGATVRTTELPAVGLYLVERDTTPAVWLVVYDEGNPHALVSNDTESARAWATTRLDEYAAQATDRGDRLDEVPASAPFADPTGGGIATPVSDGVGPSHADRATSDETASALLGGGYEMRDNRIRTPEFGTETDCTVTLWFRSASYTDGWETLVKWDYLTVGVRRGQFFGHVFDPDAERPRARTEVCVDRLQPGEWHHAAYAYDETRATLYLDGEPAATTEHDYPLIVRPLGACLGYIYRSRDTGVHWPDFTGEIVDARFYDRRLPDAVVHRIYETTAPAVHPEHG